MQAFFDRLDTNADGVLTGDEIKRPGMLARLDSDGDGKVSKDEFVKGAGQRRGERAPGEGGNRRNARGRDLSTQALRRFDRNRDGKITRDEFAGSDERFDLWDRNKDGVLTEADIADAEPGAPRGPVTPGDRPRPTLAELDQDGNGRLSRNEFPGPDEAWRRLDRNADGWISAEELEGAGPPAPPAPGGDRAEAFRRADTDGDGRVSRREFRGTDTLFDRLDRNHDGFLDAQDRPSR